MIKTIYIAGKVSGEPIHACTAKFGHTQKTIENKGYKVINPLEVVGNFNAPWCVAMRRCIAELIHVDIVVLLPDWRESKGAIIEKDLAEKLNIEVMELKTFLRLKHENKN